MGLFGVVTPNENCNWKLFYGTDYHSHLGTEFGGMAVLGHEFVRRIHRITQSQFKTEFSPDMHLFSGSMGIGVISVKDEQPLMINPVNRDLGFFVIATCGFIDNAREIIDEFIASGIGFEFEDDHETINHTKLVGMMISQADTLISGIEKMFYRIDGSMSLLVLNTDGILAARSLYGHSTLFLAQKGKDWAVTSETTALANLGFQVTSPLQPGQITLINENGPVVKSLEYHHREQLCAFLPIYTAFPAAEFGNITAEGYREQAGAYHAKSDFKTGTNGQMVAGMADSGTPYAVGYAKKSQAIIAQEIYNRANTLSSYNFEAVTDEIKILLSCMVPFERPLVKYTPGWGRSYTPPSQVDRDRIAKMKQIPVRDIWDDLEELILTEDSIVRGTQLKQYLGQLRHIVEELWGKKWPKIHVRIGCPPLAWPCKYMLSTRSRSELAARRAVTDILGHKPTDVEMTQFLEYGSGHYDAMINWIAQDLDVASLAYLPLEEMIRISQIDKDRICTYCWTGQGV